MATWEDGPEYAPLERPSAFAEPPVGTIGLENPPAPPTAPPLPVEQPAFADPTQPVPPLAALVPAPPAGRDPKQAFDVVSSVMTAESSAWASAHWAPPQPGAAPKAPPQVPIITTPDVRPGRPAQPSPYASSPYPSDPPSSPVFGPPAAGFPPPNGNPSFPPPNGSAGYPPQATFPTDQPFPADQPFPPPGQPRVPPGPYPAPGTTQWFAPGGYQQQPPPTAPDARAVLAAATPGVLVTLAIGAIIWVLSPVTLILACLLAGRMTYARKATRTSFAAVLAFLGLVGLVSVFTTYGVFSDWWANVAGWGCFGSWVMIVLTAFLVYRALKQGRPDPPPAPRGSLR